MRSIDLIAVHCSATMAGKPFAADDIRAMHTRPKPRGEGWSHIGYHRVVELDGHVALTLADETPGIHIRGHNAHSLAVCYIGGIGSDGKPADTRTEEQKEALAAVLREWREKHPRARIRGHRDLSPDLNGDGIIQSREWLKACPCFDVVSWCRSIGIEPR